MNLFKLIPLVGAVCNLLVTVFVSARGLRSTLSRVYTLWGLSLTVWNLGTYFLFEVQSPEAALFWARFLQFGVIFTPVTLFHLSLLIAEVPVRGYIRWLYGVHVALALSNFTPFFVHSVRHTGYAYYAVAGPGFWVFSVTLSLTVLSVFILLRRRRRLPRLHGRRLTALVFAQTGLVLFGINDVLPILGFHYYEDLLRVVGLGAGTGSRFPIYPYGSVAAVFYGMIVGYSVLQHQLLDIRITLGRVAANSVRVMFVFLIGLLLLLLTAALVPASQLTSTSVLTSLGVLMLTLLFSALLFPKLFGRGDEWIERTILGDRFEYHDKVRSFTGEIQSYADVTSLFGDFNDLLVNTVRVRSYNIILLDETTRQFTLFRSYPETASVPLTEVHAGSPIFQYFHWTRAEHLAYNPVYSVPGEGKTEREARQQLRQFNPEFCFPLVFDEELFGFVLLGGKTSDELFTPHDIRLLGEMVRNLSIILNQIRLKKQVLQAEELELLGRMSQGMAHDLNNLLTPVSTYLQLHQAGLLDAGKSGELLPVAMRNVTTMQSYIREALFFSQHHTPQFAFTRLDALLQEAVEIADARVQRRKAVVHLSCPPDAFAEVDSVLIQRLVGNLLANAVDASAEGGSVRIDVQRLARTEAKRDWLRIRVIDEGEGIRKDHLQRIFSPYFTTKDRGDETRGFGLGLAICRQIVHLHGGTLNVMSEEKKGTTVQVDLPSQQIPANPPAHTPPALQPA